MSDLLKIEQRNKRRLAKIHKLKRENVKLGQQRRGASNSLYIKQNKLNYSQEA